MPVHCIASTCGLQSLSEERVRIRATTAFPTGGSLEGLVIIVRFRAILRDCFPMVMHAVAGRNDIDSVIASYFAWRSLSRVIFY